MAREPLQLDAHIDLDLLLGHMRVVQLLCLDVRQMRHPLLGRLEDFGLAAHEEALSVRLGSIQKRIYGSDRKGRTYRAILERLPDIAPSCLDLDRDRIRIGRPEDLDPEDLGEYEM